MWAHAFYWPLSWMVVHVCSLLCKIPFLKKTQANRGSTILFYHLKKGSKQKRNLFCNTLPSFLWLHEWESLSPGLSSVTAGFLLPALHIPMPEQGKVAQVVLTWVLMKHLTWPQFTHLTSDSHPLPTNKGCPWWYLVSCVASKGCPGMSNMHRCNIIYWT